MIPDVKQPILIVAEEDRLEEVITRLARVGYDNTLGYLKGGFGAWKASGKEWDSIECITPEALPNIEKPTILDVRKQSEYDSEHVVDAINAPLDYINESMKKVLANEKYYVHCAGGYRSMIFISILQSRGYRNLVNINGGFSAMKASGKYPVTEYVCPSTLL